MSEAITVNPYNELEIAIALEKALTMPRNEQVKRNRVLQDRLRGADVHKWAEDFTEALQATRCRHVAPLARHLKGKAYNLLLHRFASATGRILLLDYDGTLVPFAPDPALACPDAELIDLLTELGTTPKNQVAIVSGRSRQDLERWFGNLPVTLIAEHGNCLRLKRRDWRVLSSRGMEWKDQLRPVLQCFTERLPGAWLEEKEFSLAWHYRRSRAELAGYHARELLEELDDYAQHKQVHVLSGNKVIEVRAAGATKGTAVAEWLKTLDVEFILAAGDDQTDEDMFRALPPGGFSVRVGLRETCAGHYLPDHLAVRKLLRCLVNSDDPPSHGVGIASHHLVDDCFGK
jgi:trehalose 6-phosphate synthase/phosphatase